MNAFEGRAFLFQKDPFPADVKSSRLFIPFLGLYLPPLFFSRRPSFREEAPVNPYRWYIVCSVRRSVPYASVCAERKGGGEKERLIVRLLRTSMPPHQMSFVNGGVCHEGEGRASNKQHPSIPPPSLWMPGQCDVKKGQGSRIFLHLCDV